MCGRTLTLMYRDIVSLLRDFYQSCSTESAVSSVTYFAVVSGPVAMATTYSSHFRQCTVYNLPFSYHQSQGYSPIIMAIRFIELLEPLEWYTMCW